MQFGEGIHIHTHTGIPYNFYMLLPTNEQWGIVDLTAQKPYFGENPKDGYYPIDWDQIYIFPASFRSCHISDFSDTPCIMDQGGFNETHRFLSVHYRPEVLFDLKMNASKIEILHPPLVHPIFPTSVCVLPIPRIREITMTLNLQALASPPFLGPNIKIPTFTYGISVRARKLLQLVASAAFFLGVTLASTITASLTAPLYVTIENLKRVTVKQMQAIHALSDGLTTLNHIIKNMHLEMLAIEKCIGKMEQHNLEMFQKMYADTLKNAHAIHCLQAEQP
jgi:hypothetical protein